MTFMMGVNPRQRLPFRLGASLLGHCGLDSNLVFDWLCKFVCTDREVPLQPVSGIAHVQDHKVTPG